MMIDQLAAKIRDGGRLDRAEALELYLNAPTALLGQLADEVRARHRLQKELGSLEGELS